MLAFGDSSISNNGAILRIDSREHKIHDLQKLEQSFFSMSQNQTDTNQFAVGYSNAKWDIFDIRSLGKPGTIQRLTFYCHQNNVINTMMSSKTT